MELTVDFYCPRCRTALPFKLLELGPGQQRLCPACHLSLELTHLSLRALARDLALYCCS